MREIDRRATEESGIPSLLLMENAGRAVADKACEMLGDPHMKMVLVMCGPGNNGGDGIVAARHLRQAGALPLVAYFGDREKAKGDALTNIEIAEQSGMDLFFDLDPKGRWDRVPQDIDLIIDALLGTGTKGEVREPFASLIARINDMSAADHTPVLSVDIPSGVDADTGQTLGPCVAADATVTLALPKVGVVTYPGASLVGQLSIADIGIPEKVTRLASNAPGVFLTRWFDAMPLGMLRSIDSHKGLYGHVAIIAGSVGMTGAATLAAEGALRIGAGLVTVLVPESLNDIMEVKLTEAMTIPVPEGKARAFGMASLEKVLGYVNKWDAAVIGPGFGRAEDTIAFTLELIKRLEKPAIIDADALYAISKDQGVLRECKAPLVITPHPGEMATLLGTTSKEVQSNRLETARAFAKEHGVTVVLKGAGTVISDPDGKAYINTTGSPGMATGGTGDVLSGMIGGLLAQSQGDTSVAAAAVYLHGLAGEIAADKLSEPAMLASDLATCIGDAILRVQNETQSWDNETKPTVCAEPTFDFRLKKGVIHH